MYHSRGSVRWGATVPEELRRLTHRTVKQVTDLHERFRYNVALSRLMELTTEARRVLDRGRPARQAVEAIVLMLAPMAPFVAEELWREVLGRDGSVHLAGWPAFDEELAREDTVTLVVQVDGKVRDTMEVPADIDEEKAVELALASEKVGRALDGREVRRVVARPPRLVNLVTGG